MSLERGLDQIEAQVETGSFVVEEKAAVLEVQIAEKRIAADFLAFV